MLGTRCTRVQLPRSRTPGFRWRAWTDLYPCGGMQRAFCAAMVVAMPGPINNLRLADAERTAWIFGAGASAPAPYEVPTQARVLHHLMTMTRPGGATVQAKFDALRERVKTHAKVVLPGRELVDDDVTLEELFCSFELTMRDARSTNDEVAGARQAFDDFIQALRLSTYVFGRGDSNKWKPHERSGVASPYAELIEKLIPAGAFGPIDHTFITFNYDVNLDRCLINLRGSAADFDLDYGFALANSRCEDAPKFDLPRADRSVLLLRTHGALNWIRCRACRAVFTTVAKQGEIPEDLTCFACGKRRMDYVLVHPSYYRSYDDPILQLVWGRTYEELVRADRWVFIGYSLPPADVHFRELLRDAVRARRNDGKEVDVVLVTRGPTTDAAFAASQRTYEGLFHGQLSVWQATAGGFGDFVRSIV